MGSAGPESTKVRRLKAYSRRRLATYGAGAGEKLENAGPKSAKGRRLEAYDGRRLATYGASSGDKWGAQGMRARRGKHSRPMIGGISVKCRA